MGNRYLSLEERFHQSYIKAPSGCWIWTKSWCKGYYGQIRNDGVLRFAHRVSWELHVGPIPDGLEVDHLCRQKSCVNPLHLQPVTPSENQRRAGQRIGIWKKRFYEHQAARA